MTTNLGRFLAKRIKSQRMKQWLLGLQKEPSYAEGSGWRGGSLKFLKERQVIEGLSQTKDHKILWGKGARYDEALKVIQ